MIIFRHTIPYKEMRYPTAGDWRTIAGNTTDIFAVQMKDPRWTYLITIHEEIEADLCRHTGIKEEDVTAFDIAYEECRRLKLDRAPCGCELWDEPGDDLHAPYRDAHRTASHCERLIAKALNVDWDAYERAVMKL